MRSGQFRRQHNVIMRSGRRRHDEGGKSHGTSTDCGGRGYCARPRGVTRRRVHGGWGGGGGGSVVIRLHFRVVIRLHFRQEAEELFALGGMSGKNTHHASGRVGGGNVGRSPTRILITIERRRSHHRPPFLLLFTSRELHTHHFAICAKDLLQARLLCVGYLFRHCGMRVPGRVRARGEVSREGTRGCNRLKWIRFRG